MAKRVFTDESLTTFVDEIKSYTDEAVSGKANTSHTHSISNVSNLQSTLDGKAASSHTHVAGDITSGTFASGRLPTVPIKKGGTGATTAEAALTNLGASAVGHNHQTEFLAPIALELHPGSSAGHGGYIDFHYNDSASDYTSRIIEASSGTINVQSTNLQHNGLKVLTDGIIVDVYNASVAFTNGVATYSNSNIKKNAVVIVQRRGSTAGANTSYCTHTNSNGGSVTICCSSNINETHALNMIITNI